MFNWVLRGLIALMRMTKGKAKPVNPPKGFISHLTDVSTYLKQVLFINKIIFYIDSLDSLTNTIM